jgi:4a-hydroxytetrahydrobiopterin dehydratase
MVLKNEEVKKIISQDLPGWEFTDFGIEKFIPRNKYFSPSDFIEIIWKMAERMNHHPDLLLKYSGIKITLITHDENGVTNKDIDLAKKINSILLG